MEKCIAASHIPRIYIYPIDDEFHGRKEQNTHFDDKQEISKVKSLFGNENTVKTTLLTGKYILSYWLDIFHVWVDFTWKTYTLSTKYKQIVIYCDRKALKGIWLNFAPFTIWFAFDITSKSHMTYAWNKSTFEYCKSLSLNFAGWYLTSDKKKIYI